MKNVSFSPTTCPPFERNLDVIRKEWGWHEKTPYERKFDNGRIKSNVQRSAKNWLEDHGFPGDTQTVDKFLAEWGAAVE